MPSLTIKLNQLLFVEILNKTWKVSCLYWNKKEKLWNNEQLTSDCWRCHVWTWIVSTAIHRKVQGIFWTFYAVRYLKTLLLRFEFLLFVQTICQFWSTWTKVLYFSNLNNSQTFSWKHLKVKIETKLDKGLFFKDVCNFSTFLTPCVL